MTADSAAPNRLFVYGTLMMPAVRRAVCGVTLASRDAELMDYARFQLRQRVYPAIVPAPGAATVGLLCEGLNAALWERLDAWESALYRREAVVTRGADGMLIAAQTYVLAARHRHLLGTDAWSPAEFERLHLSAYLARWTDTTP